MGFYVGRGRKARRAFGFDEVAIVPGRVTINPEEVDTTWELGNLKFDVPILAAAMDGVVNTKVAIEMSRLGGLGVLNLEGVQTRYAEPDKVLDEIAGAGPDTATQLVQKLYSPPIKKELIGKRIQEIKDGGAVVAVSGTPMAAAKFGELAEYLLNGARIVGESSRENDGVVRGNIARQYDPITVEDHSA